MEACRMGLEGHGSFSYLEVGVVDEFEDQAGRLRLRVSNNVEQADDVRPAGEVLQNLDLALDLLLLDWLEDLYNHLWCKREAGSGG